MDWTDEKARELVPGINQKDCPFVWARIASALRTAVEAERAECEALAWRAYRVNGEPAAREIAEGIALRRNAANPR